MAKTQPASLLECPAPADRPASAWQLRAQFGERTWTLAHGTSALGLDERCGLRVQGAGVQAWHCLVTHGAQRTIVRRLATAARLNGNSFTEAELTPGDRLEIGSVELQLIEVDDRTSRQSAETPQNVERTVGAVDLQSNPRTPTRRPTHHEDHSPLASRMIQAADERRMLARCARKLGRKARRLEATAVSLESQWRQRLRRIEREDLSTAEADRQRSAELTGLGADLAACRAELGELAEQQRVWRSDRGTLESKLADLAEQVTTGRGLLDQCNQGLSDCSAAFDGLRGRCEAHDAAHRHTDERFADLLTATDARLAALDERIASLQTDVERQATDAAAKDVAIANDHRTFDGRIAELDGQLAGLAEKVAAATRLDLFHRLEEQTTEWGGRLDAISARVEEVAATPQPTATAMPESLALLDAQIVAVREELSVLSERSGADASERQQAENKAAEALAQVAALAARIDESTAEASWRDDRLAEIEPLRVRCETLESQVSELRTRQAAMLEERDAWQHEHRRAQEQLAIRSEQIDRKLESLAVQQQAFQNSRETREHDDTHQHFHGHGHRGPMDRLAELQAEREVREQERRRERAEQLLSRHVGGCVPQNHEPLLEAERPSAAERPLVEKVPSSIEIDQHEPTVESTPAASETLASESPTVEPSSQEARMDDRIDQPIDATEATLDEPRSPVSSPRSEYRNGLEQTEEPNVTVQLPLHTAEVLERLANQPASETQEQRRAPRKPTEVDEQEESIEDYMARLMNRVRGITSTSSEKPRRSEQAPPPAAREPSTPSRRPAMDEVRAPVEEVETPPTEEKPKPVEIRRRPPPERLIDMSAMRELANMNARSAIDTHAKKRLGTERKTKLLVAIFSAVVCLALIALGNLGDRMVQAGIAASALAALVFTWRCLKLSGQRNKQPRSGVGGPVAVSRSAESTATAPSADNGLAGDLLPGAAAKDDSSV